MSDPAQPREGAISRAADRAWTAGGVALYLVLAIGYGLAWEPAHDEGVTWGQTFGDLEIARTVDDATPIARLFATINGEDPREPADVIDALMKKPGMHPPGYYLLLLFWGKIFGTGRLVLSVPALLFGVLALLSLRNLANRVLPGGEGNSGPGKWALLFLALSPWFLGFTLLARPYLIALALALASTDLLVALARDTRHRKLRLAGFLVLSIAGMYCLYHYALLLAWQGVFLAWVLLSGSPSRRRALATLGVLGALLTAAYLPWVPNLLAHLDVAGEREYYFSGILPLADWPEALGSLLLLFGLGEALSIPGPGFRVVAAILGAVTLPFVLIAFVRGRRFGLDATARRFFVSLAVLPALYLAVDLTRGTHTFFITKTGFIFLPVLILLVVRAWATLPRPGLRRIGLSVWAAFLLSATLATVVHRTTTTIPYEELARHVKEHDRSSHVVVLPTILRGYALPLILTLREAGVEQIRVVHAPPPRLRETVEAATRDPSVETVTLVTLAATYILERTWSLEQLRDAAEAARNGDWRAQELIGGRDSGPQRPRTLWVTPAVEVKYYSM